jgi:hypothetical protein
MVTARRWRPFLDYKAGWRDANHNIGRCGAEGQRPHKNQSNQSLENHNTFSSYVPAL